MNLNDLSDDELDNLRIEVLIEQERRQTLANAPAQADDLARFNFEIDALKNLAAAIVRESDLFKLHLHRHRLFQPSLLLVEQKGIQRRADKTSQYR